MKLPALPLFERNCAVAKPAFTLTSYGAVHLPFHLSSPGEAGSPLRFDKLHGIQAKANKANIGEKRWPVKGKNSDGKCLLPVITGPAILNL